MELAHLRPRSRRRRTLTRRLVASTRGHDEIICGRAAVDSLVPRWMRDHLGELSMLGIASRTERNRGESGGRYYEYALDTNPNLLLEALDETVDMVGVTDAVQQRPDQDL